MIALILIGIILVIVVAGYLASPQAADTISYLPIDISKKYLKPSDWKGTPFDSKGRFQNHEYPFYQDILRIFIWLPGHLLNLFKNRATWFPVNYHGSADVLNKNGTLIWLGHASFFLRINDINILIDPHFNNTFIYKRHTDNPVPPGFFTDIHYILLSHDHADHCDKTSLQLLIGNNPGVTFLCGLNMELLVQSFVKQKVNAITAEWYEEFSLADSLKIYFVPSRHYSKRIFEKFNSRLWGGFVIRYKDSSGTFQTIYYGGDSGYGSHFKEIKELFKPGIAILPIGSYMPRWFMKPNHMSPGEVLQAFNDCGAHLLIPMHYGTFNLSNEDMDAPKKTLMEIIPPRNLIDIEPGVEYKI